MEEDSRPWIAGLNSEDFLDWVDKNLEEEITKTRPFKLLDKIVYPFLNWAKRNSIWPLHMGIMCCSIEMAAAFDPIYDVERHGILYRSSPRQIDIMLVNGPVSRKWAKGLLRLYHQIPDPKWVIAMGECSICGGPYFDSYNVLKGVHTIMPVDIYIPGCPPRPEALMDAFLKLKEKIKQERKGAIKTLKGRDVSSIEGQFINPELEINAMKKGWNTQEKEFEKIKVKPGGSA